MVRAVIEYGRELTVNISHSIAVFGKYISICHIIPEAALQRRESAVNQEDLLVWPDGFWCYRKDHDPELEDKLRSEYRIIQKDSEEWQQYTLLARLWLPRKKPG